MKLNLWLWLPDKAMTANAGNFSNIFFFFFFFFFLGGGGDENRKLHDLHLIALASFSAVG